MIVDKEVNYSDWIIEGRDNQKKDGWVSSVKLSRMGISTKKLRKICSENNNEAFLCIRFNISGAIKYWFKNGIIPFALENCKC